MLVNIIIIVIIVITITFLYYKISRMHDISGHDINGFDINVNKCSLECGSINGKIIECPPPPCDNDDDNMSINKCSLECGELESGVFIPCPPPPCDNVDNVTLGDNVINDECIC